MYSATELTSTTAIAELISVCKIFLKIIYRKLLGLVHNDIFWIIPENAITIFQFVEYAFKGTSTQKTYLSQCDFCSILRY